MNNVSGGEWDIRAVVSVTVDWQVVDVIVRVFAGVPVKRWFRRRRILQTPQSMLIMRCDVMCVSVGVRGEFERCRCRRHRPTNRRARRDRLVRLLVLLLVVLLLAVACLATDCEWSAIIQITIRTEQHFFFKKKKNYR